MMSAASWWRETGRLYLRYMVAAAASVPTAIVYVYFRNAHSRVVDGILIAGGLTLAGIAWHFAGYVRPMQTEVRPTMAVTAGVEYGLIADVEYGLASAHMTACFVIPEMYNIADEHGRENVLAEPQVMSGAEVAALG